MPFRMLRVREQIINKLREVHASFMEVRESEADLRGRKAAIPPRGEHNMNRQILRQARTLAITCILALGATATPVHAGGANHSDPLTGTWRVVVTTFNCQTLIENPPFTSFLTFGAGGTLLETTSSPLFQPGQRSPGHGFWQRTGRKFYRSVFEGFVLFASSPPLPPLVRGRQRVDQGLQMTGPNSFVADATTTFFNVAGEVVTEGCARAVGERME
jgi:hypothetical protein